MGLYTFAKQDDIDPQELKKLQEKFEKARQANANISDAVAATANAYGNVGDANGVTVQFSQNIQTGEGAAVSGSAVYNRDTGMFEYQCVVTINTKLTGVELEAAVGHEGSHVADGQAFVATIYENYDYDLSVLPTHYETEMKAYLITDEILRTANTNNLSFSTNKDPVLLGQNESRKKVEKKIKKY